MRDIEKLMNEYLASHISPKVLQQLLKIVESAGVLKRSKEAPNMAHEDKTVYQAIINLTVNEEYPIILNY